jgi:hypothetical protein
MLIELDEAGHSGDADWEVRCSHYLSQIVDWAEADDKEGGLSPRIPNILIEDTKEMRASKREQILDWWKREQGNYPPWWDFWSGTRRVSARREVPCSHLALGLPAALRCRKGLDHSGDRALIHSGEVGDLPEPPPQLEVVTVVVV